MKKEDFIEEDVSDTHGAHIIAFVGPGLFEHNLRTLRTIGQ